MLAPEPSPGACTKELTKGCRALTFNYAASSTATGEGQPEWGDYSGRLTRVYFTAWNPTTSAMATTEVAHYLYDSQGRLRAEWNPQVEASSDCGKACPALKTTYGYDAEGHVTAVSAAGLQPEILTYGTTSGDPSSGRLLKAFQPPAATALGTGKAPSATGAPTLTGTAFQGNRIGVSNGTWNGSPLAYSYQWQHCSAAGSECQTIAGADGQNYVPVGSDVGAHLRAVVTATNAFGSTASATPISEVLAQGAGGTSEAPADAPQPGTTIEYGLPASGAEAVHQGTSFHVKGFWALSGEYGAPMASTIDSQGDVWAMGLATAEGGPGLVEEYSASGALLHKIPTGSCLPTGISANRSGDVWVSEVLCAKLQEYNSEGKLVRQFFASHNSETSFPGAVAQDHSGNVFDLNLVIGKEHIWEFSEKGAFEREFASPGTGTGQLDVPRGLATDTAGDLWIADTGNNRLDEFSPAGAFMKSVGFGVADGKAEAEVCTTSCRAGIAGSGEGQLDRPVGVTVDASGHVFAADSLNSRIVEFSGESGAYIGQLGGTGTTPAGLQEPNSVSVAPSGSLWVSDEVTGKASEYTLASGGLAPHQMGSTEVAAWAQKDDPVEATAIFPPDEPESWPASDYRRATLFYLDNYSQTVNAISPTGGVATSEYYPGTENVKRSLSADNRLTALKEGAKSAEVAEHLSGEATYNKEGTELESSLGPEHKIKLAGGAEVEARKRAAYNYDEGEPSDGGVYKAVTKTSEAALVGGKEEEPQVVKSSYSGQSNLGWKLDEPTSTTTAANTLDLIHSTGYSTTTGAPTEARSPGGPTYTSKFGSPGNDLGYFQNPSGIATDAHGNLWITDYYNGRVEVFSPGGTALKEFGTPGSGELQFSEPQGIAINQGTGKVYIADQNNNRVEIYNEEGKHEGKIGEAGSKSGAFNGIQDVALDESGDLWTTDWGNNRVEEFSSEGKFMREFGECGQGKEQLLQPTGIAIHKGTVYVANYGHSQIDEFSATGGCIGQFGESGSEPGQIRYPNAIKFSSSGNLYLADAGNSRIDVFTESGAYVDSFGSKGSGNGQFSEPEGVAFGSSGAIYVTDGANNRVEEWLPPIGNEGARDSQTIYYSSGTEATVAACQNHPEWANLPCQTQPLHQPEVQAPLLPNLPVTTFTYNLWDEPTVTKSTVGTATRTETATYDAAGRLTGKETTSTAKEEVALPAVKDTYSPTTGLLVKQSTGSGSEEKSISSVYNSLAQLTSYTDAEESTATYTYDIDGRVSSVSDAKGSQTYGYDPTTGELTSLLDSSLGATPITATYDAEGHLLTEGYPGGLTAHYTYNAEGQPTALEYVKGKAVWYSDSVVPSIRGQWMSQNSTTSSETYAYDEANRLIEVQDTVKGNCTTRVYTYDVDGNRTDLQSHPPGVGGKCSSEGGTEERHSYDTANRLLDSGTSYETFGAIAKLPGADAGGGALTSGFYADGQLEHQSQAPVEGQTKEEQTLGYKLDPARRTRETISTGKVTRNQVSHYDGPGTAPAWLSYPPTSEWTREITGIDGQLVAQQLNTEKPRIQIADLHGDIVATAAINQSENEPLTLEDMTEFGVPTTSAPPKRAWLGAGDFPTELPSGVIGLGARSYVPEIGRFLQPDPKPGGSANAYAYTYGNPLNESDPSGEESEYRIYSPGLTYVEGVGESEGAMSAIVPPTAAEDEAGAYGVDPEFDQFAAGDEEYDEYEEEGEEVAYHPGLGRQAEAGGEQGLLYQPLEEGVARSEAMASCETASGASCTKEVYLYEHGHRVGSACTPFCGTHGHVRAPGSSPRRRGGGSGIVGRCVRGAVKGAAIGTASGAAGGAAAGSLAGGVGAAPGAGAGAVSGGVAGAVSGCLSEVL